MYCIKCGTRNDDDSKFCIKCGTDLREYAKPVEKVIERPKIPNKIPFKDILKDKKKLRTIGIIIFATIILGAIVLILPNFNNQNDSDDIDDGILGEQISTNSTIIPDTVIISISSIPSNANVYINNKFKGMTPVNINLPEGSYRLAMNLTGYKGIKTYFNITSDMERQEINVTFEPIGTS